MVLEIAEIGDYLKKKETFLFYASDQRSDWTVKNTQRPSSFLLILFVDMYTPFILRSSNKQDHYLSQILGTCPLTFKNQSVFILGKGTSRSFTHIHSAFLIIFWDEILKIIEFKKTIFRVVIMIPTSLIVPCSHSNFIHFTQIKIPILVPCQKKEKIDGSWPNSNNTKYL